jgi:hypothetical protein
MPARAAPLCAGDVGDCPVAKVTCSRDFSAKFESVEIVVHRVTQFPKGWSPLLQKCHARVGSPPRAFCGLACCACGCLRAGRIGSVGQIGCRRPFSFSKAFSNLVSKLNCKFNIKICRSPKIMKLILLGS